MRNVFKRTKVNTFVVSEFSVAHVAVVFDNLANMLGR